MDALLGRAFHARPHCLRRNPSFISPGPSSGLPSGLDSARFIAYLAFQLSIGIGKVTVGWLFMNLSAGVPALVSIWFYGEKLTPLKSVAFCLALIALFCLFQGNRLEAREATHEKLQEKLFGFCSCCSFCLPTAWAHLV